MNDNNHFYITVKDYAEQRGKTVQAVYQQMKRQENPTALNGHIHFKRVGNKDVKYLDEEAVAILDEGSRSTPTVISQDNLKTELATVQEELDVLKNQLFYKDGQIQMLKELLTERDQRLLLLQEPQRQIDELTAQNVDLSLKKEKQAQELAQTQESLQKASDELTKTTGKLTKATEELQAYQNMSVIQFIKTKLKK